MTTIINNPGNRDVGGEARGEGSNFALMIVLLLIIVGGILLYVYGFPGRQDTNDVNFSVPETVDINVKTPDVTPGGTDGGAAQGGGQ